MKITYTPNPLKTVIELEPMEIELLRHKIIIEELKDAICGGWMHLDKDDPKWYDPEKARQELDHEYWYSDKFKERIQELLDYYIADLKGSHCGDCTCVPCSCGKCHAESMLGIDTIKGLGKHSAHKIDFAFSPGTPRTGMDRTIDEAIASLEVKDFSWDKLAADSPWKSIWAREDYESHIPRWQKEAADALAWLKNYRDTHFKGE